MEAQTQKETFDCNEYKTCIKENTYLQVHFLLNADTKEERDGDWATKEQMDTLHNVIKNLIDNNLFPRIGEVIDDNDGYSHITDIWYQFKDTKTIIHLFLD